MRVDVSDEEDGLTLTCLAPSHNGLANSNVRRVDESSVRETRTGNAHLHSCIPSHLHSGSTVASHGAYIFLQIAIVLDKVQCLNNIALPVVRSFASALSY